MFHTQSLSHQSLFHSLVSCKIKNFVISHYSILLAGNTVTRALLPRSYFFSLWSCPLKHIRVMELMLPHLVYQIFSQIHFKENCSEVVFTSATKLMICRPKITSKTRKTFQVTLNQYGWTNKHQTFFKQTKFSLKYIMAIYWIVWDSASAQTWMCGITHLCGNTPLSPTIWGPGWSQCGKVVSFLRYPKVN